MMPAALKHFFTFAGATLAVYHAKKGEGIPKHIHKHNHATMCNAGSCLITVEDKSIIINKNSKPVNLTGAKWHQIEALEDGTIFVNVFAEGKN